MSEVKESHDKLISYQMALDSEEEMLNRLLLKIEQQIHSLQVEQLNILDAINKKNSQSSGEPVTQRHAVYVKSETYDQQNEDLDLSVTHRFQSSEEEDDDDDEIDD